MMTALAVRPYEASDRPGLFRLAADTAFFGEPIESFIEDRQLFCLETLRQQRIPGVHLQTTDRNVAACQLYTGMGMQLLAARFERLWAHILGAPIESRCYGMRLVDVHSESARA